MPVRKAIDEKLEALESLRARDDASARAEGLGAALRDKSARVVAKAARLCAEGLHYDLVPGLVGAFRRLSAAAKPAKADPSCAAKQAIARALVELDCEDVDVFVEGLAYRQPEPVWGGTADTAADVRASCAMGLVATGYRRALVAVSTLLFDSEAAARLGAVRAVACGNPQEAELLLHAKVLAGDTEHAVIGEAFAGLLSVAPEESVEFVASYLSAGDEVHRELAALALGESHLDAALAPLKAAWQADPLVDLQMRRVLMGAAAAHRTAAALEWLESIFAEADARTVRAGIDALLAYRHDTKLAAALDEALERRGDRDLLAEYVRAWGRDGPASGPSLQR